MSTGIYEIRGFGRRALFTKNYLVRSSLKGFERW
jgi:hypothetical protein